jgi:hypothetical protein
MKSDRSALLVATIVVVNFTLAPGAFAAWECPELDATAESCGQSVCPEDGVQAEDALAALRAAVGAAYCAACRCDVDSSGGIGATDSLKILRSAVGSPGDLECPACNSLTLHPVESAAPGTAPASEDPISAASLPPQWFSYSSTLLADGRTAVIGRQQLAPLTTRLLLLDDEGEVTSNSILFDGVGTDGRLTCAAGTARCVTTYRFLSDSETPYPVLVFNVDAVEEQDAIFLKGVVEEGEGDTEISTGAGPERFACDESGICVAAWLLARTTIVDQDASDTEYLGYYARAFNAHTGEAGPEIALADTDPMNVFVPAVTALGDDVFRIVLPAGDVFVFEVR